MTAALNPVPKRRGMRFRTFADIAGETSTKRHLIKGALAWGETSAWIGPPGSLKSALLADACVAVATGRPWRGLRNKGAAAVLYLALERGDLVARRLRAHAERDGINGPPIALVGELVNLMSPACVPVILDTIRSAEEVFGMPVGLVVVDTIAKAIAAGGGDEDKARDQGAVFANLQRIKSACPAHIALVGHTGKDESRGARGSNAIVGDVDMLVSISGDRIKSATVTKANDAPEGLLFRFQDEVYSFGQDEDGDEITANIISRDPVDGEPMAAPIDRKLSPRQHLALSALWHVVDGGGLTPPASLNAPPGTRVVLAESWRDEMHRNGAIDPAGSNPRADFLRLRQALAARQMIGSRDGYVWAVAGV